MGGISKYFDIDATSSEVAYNRIINSEKRQHGEGFYNGSAATCRHGYCKLKFDEYSEKNMDEINSYIDSVNGGEKYVLDYCDAGVVGYLLVTTKTEVGKQGKPNGIAYQVYARNKELYGDKLKWVGHYYNKNDALKDAERLSLSAIGNPSTTYVVRDYGEDSVQEKDDLYRIVKTSQKVDKIVETKKGQVLIPLHKFVFFGFASY